jgi:NAD(P)-dependent dehydrogenase (short-subunit alcohol dehydrogenase family)
VVTGSSSGIGRQTALDLARDGARVVVAARRRDRLEALVDEMGGASSGHSLFVTDVSDREQVLALAEHTADLYGRCDALVNNAGLSDERPLDQPGAIEDLERVMATNFFGAVWCTAALLPLLMSCAPSSVVNVASIAGRLAGVAPAYTASKFALVGWSEALRFQLAPHGVWVSLVEPGPIPTEGFDQSAYLQDPLMRHVLGTTQDVSRAIRATLVDHKMQRVVPRWYYLLQLPRVVAPPLFRIAQRGLAARRATKEGS